MSNTSTDSVSSQIVLISEASERINSVSQCTENTIKCCPLCRSSLIQSRSTQNTYYCANCHKNFKTPNERTKGPTYELCEACRQVFVPVTYPLINGKRLCSQCAPRDYDLSRRESTILTKLSMQETAYSTPLTALAILLFFLLIMGILLFQVCNEIFSGIFTGAI